MSKPFLEIALAAVLAYRFGWHVGASRMAASLVGRPSGMTSWPRRIAAWRKTRKAVADDRPIQIVTVAPQGVTPQPPITPRDSGGTDAGPSGQYL